MVKCSARFLAVLAILAANGYSQTGVGQIQGTVNDSTGAVIPGAAVELEQVQTSNKLRSVTSDVGFYVFPSLAPGAYRLTVTAAGMQRWEGQVDVALGQQAVVNASLTVATA